MNLLNVGCGTRFHPSWTNVDLVSRHDEVEEYDLRRGLPYSESSFDGVYHSHVLEHLPPEEGIALLSDCFRVLKPGGILRVVVPDLEAIVRGYLEQLDAVSQGQSNAEGRYDWMTYELLDQMVRCKSGGQMGPVMHDPNETSRDFILKRLGDEITNGASGGSVSQKRRKLSFAYWSSKIKKLRVRVSKQLVSLILPELNAQAVEETRFRQSGEIHRWMYDRFSLCRALTNVGFEGVRVESAHTSRIEEFDAYQLDAAGERVRKPDSLFVEGVKPLAQAMRAA